MKKVFTVVFNHAGGTYIEQYEAAGITEAVEKWCISVSRNPYFCRNAAEAEEWLTDARDDSPVEVDGVRLTWCVSGLLNDKLVLANFILTEVGAKGKPVQKRKDRKFGKGIRAKE